MKDIDICTKTYTIDQSIYSAKHNPWTLQGSVNNLNELNFSDK